MNNTQTIQQELISFFERVSTKDEALLDAIRQQPGFEINPEQWCFTLPDLHAFLQQYSDVFSELEYSQFRQSIYSSQINQAIKPHGAEIMIHDNQAKVDQSVYVMVWHTT